MGIALINGIKIVRFTDWPERLNAYITANLDTRFSWGRFDCALFACNAVLEMTGVDLAAEWRGKYRDEEGARKIAGETFMTFGADIARAHGLPLIDPKHARRGDIVLADQTGKGFETFGIMLDGYVIAPGNHGLKRIPLTMAIAAWRV